MVIYSIKSTVQFDSNIFLIIGNRTILIDTGSGYGSEKIIQNIRNALDGRSLDSVILTHCHFDHIGGLNKIIETFGCKAFAGGDATYIRYADPVVTLYEDFEGELSPTDVEELSDGTIMDIGEHRLRVINTPGHTAGSISLYDEVTSSLFSGDTVFNNGIGRTDMPSGSSSDMQNSFQKLSNIDIKTLYPGHGPSAFGNGNESVRYGIQMMGGF